jgi:hypothetical protein
MRTGFPVLVLLVSPALFAPESTNVPPILVVTELLASMLKTPSLALVFPAILVYCVKPTSTNALPILVAMVPHVLIPSINTPAPVWLVIPVFYVKPTSTNALPILVATEQPAWIT